MAGKSGRTINATPQNVWRKRILSWEGVLIVILAVVLVLCRAMSATYTLENVLREMPKYLAEMFLMLPMAFILMMGEIDISVGSIVCLSGTLGCFAVNAGMPFPVALLIMLGTGLICGAINGAIIVIFPELPSMIVTLGTQIIFRGIAEIMLGGGGSIAAKNADGFRTIGKSLGIVPIVFFLVIISGAIFVIISTKMKFGRELMAIGSNRLTAFYSGVKVKKVLFISYVTMGAFSALCAIFFTAATYGANTTTGKGFEMDAIAMAVFGGISSTGGKGKMIGGILSAFVIVCLRIGLGQKNVNSQVILLIIGILLIGAVLLPNISARISASKKKAIS
ncbi:MAG: ABC transporter permease [Agathobacter sp.]|uniref:ABC transporter permease n=1 Tax=Agathobacter sp. TaxID=2021311 RepID=UPI00258A501E|nr:ABC transporter permease [Agathobacter sp.]MCR5677289.1 ABC transporter permease [Agathobacter sp.]